MIRHSIILTFTTSKFIFIILQQRVAKQTASFSPYATQGTLFLWLNTEDELSVTASEKSGGQGAQTAAAVDIVFQCISGLLQAPCLINITFAQLNGSFCVILIYTQYTCEIINSGKISMTEENLGQR